MDVGRWRDADASDMEVAIPRSSYERLDVPRTWGIQAA